MNIVNILAGNTQVLTVKGVATGGDPTTGPLVYRSDAVVTATLFDANENPVAGLIGVSLTYVTGSNGWYEYTIPASFSPTPGVNYTLIVSISVATSNLSRRYPVNVIDET